MGFTGIPGLSISDSPIPKFAESGEICGVFPALFLFRIILLTARIPILYFVGNQYWFQAEERGWIC
jgi:hypothetical protein